MEQTHQLVTNENILLQTLGTLKFWFLFLIFKTLFTVKVIQYIEIYVVNEYWIINLIQIKTNRCFIFTGFDLSIEHPHTNVVKTCQLVKGKHLFWNLIEISSVGKKTSRLSQNMVLDFCLLCKVKKDLYGAGKDITRNFHLADIFEKFLLYWDLRKHVT